jgi:mannitol-1-phosphate 5-dehydrogenase
MKIINKEKIVLFGAGKIGRSFIGQLFSRGGYEVVFIDTNRQVIDELNKRGKYRIIIKSDKEEIIDISNVRGVLFYDEEKVVSEVAEAGIVAVSVGIDGLGYLFPLLAKGLLERQKIDSEFPLDIIIAENMRNADDYFQKELKKLLPVSYQFGKLVGLIETSIGKMVPIMHKKDTKDDILLVFAEPYNTLILNKKGFRNPIPAIDGLSPKENMKAWVDRKLFIHNLGHSAAAYIGFLHNPEFVFMYEALEVSEVFDHVRETMLQSAYILLKKYPDEFSLKDLTEHIDDLLNRFQNRALGDTIFRVGCDLMRKLGPYDRLSGAVRVALEFELKYDKILYALVCGCHFRAKDEDSQIIKGDIEFEKVYNKGIRSVLTDVCGFNEIQYADLFSEAEQLDRTLKNRKAIS